MSFELEVATSIHTVPKHVKLLQTFHITANSQQYFSHTSNPKKLTPMVVLDRRTKVPRHVLVKRGWLEPIKTKRVILDCVNL